MKILRKIRIILWVVLALSFIWYLVINRNNPKDVSAFNGPFSIGLLCFCGLVVTAFIVRFKNITKK